MMDATRLLIGQKVTLSSGRYRDKGNVIEITPSGWVYVETESGERIRFNRYGKEPDYGRSAYSYDNMCECGPWQIDVPAAVQETAKAWVETEWKVSLVYGYEQTGDWSGRVDGKPWWNALYAGESD